MQAILHSSNLTKPLVKRNTAKLDDPIIEFYNHINEEVREAVASLLNIWWGSKQLDTEAVVARVVHLYKKGNTAHFKNYRPISLLNILYKLYTRLIQTRLANALDHKLHKTESANKKVHNRLFT